MWKRRGFVGLAAGLVVAPFIRSGMRADGGDMIPGDPAAPSAQVLKNVSR